MRLPAGAVRDEPCARLPHLGQDVEAGIRLRPLRHLGRGDAVLVRPFADARQHGDDGREVRRRRRGRWRLGCRGLPAPSLRGPLGGRGRGVHLRASFFWAGLGWAGGISSPGEVALHAHMRPQCRRMPRFPVPSRGCGCFTRRCLGYRFFTFDLQSPTRQPAFEVRMRDETVRDLLEHLAKRARRDVEHARDIPRMGGDRAVHPDVQEEAEPRSARLHAPPLEALVGQRLGREDLEVRQQVRSHQPPSPSHGSSPNR